MLITVIIPFRNAAITLQSCLDALLSQKYKQAEFILIDNNSTDKSLDIAQRFIEQHPLIPIKILSEPTPGASAARNRGAKEAKGDWLVFTDSDCVPEPSWLTELARHIESEPKIGAIAGCIYPADTDSIIGKFLGLFTLPANTQQRILKSYTLVDGGFPTANFAIRKSLFNQIGGFDENIRIYGEDHDLCLKIYSAGYEIKAVTNAIVKHIHRENLTSLVKQAYGFGTAHALLMRRMPVGILLIHTPLGDITKLGEPCRIWLDFNQADKKILVVVLAACVYTPLLVLPFAYLAYLCACIFKRGMNINQNIMIPTTLVMACLLLVKSFSLTCGRFAGSFRYGVICV